MCSALCDTIFCNNNNLICIFDRGQTVCDCDGRSVLGQFFQTVLDPAFTLVIKSTGCFIKDQDRWIL